MKPKILVLCDDGRLPSPFYPGTKKSMNGKIIWGRKTLTFIRSRIKGGISGWVTITVPVQMNLTEGPERYTNEILDAVLLCLKKHKLPTSDCCWLEIAEEPFRLAHNNSNEYMVDFTMGSTLETIDLYEQWWYDLKNPKKVI